MFTRAWLNFSVVLLVPLIFHTSVITTENASPEPPNVSKHKNINLLPTECGNLETGDRLINGNKTGLFEFPWMALLIYQAKNTPIFFCGGTIINDKYILTAAHCISDASKDIMKVRVGEHNINKPIDCEKGEDKKEICAPPFQDLAVEEIIPHPQYSAKLYTNDIALLRVSAMDSTVDNVKSVCLPLENTRNFNFTRRNGIITGWGTTETGHSSLELLKIKIPIIAQEECVQTYTSSRVPSPIAITHRQLCAGGKTKSDSCTGDSGGPLQVVGTLHEDSRIIQQGVVSFGPMECAKQGIPGVYTRVAYYMDWILNNIKP